MPPCETAPPRRPSVTATTASESLAALDVPALRSRRSMLDAEADRVAYWTTLTRARIDGLELHEEGERPLTLAQLVEALGDTGSGRRRRTIASQSGTGDLPALPDVAHMWAVDVDVDDRLLVARTLAGLVPAERQLVAYRIALDDLMDDSTRELILRYRDDPRTALDALPAA